mmetsp:Transcript_132586/g.383258  ORF Transcript_132586/g.383258 Transcript_132586/m.383258 type:complete len:493 (-) Transcript_132586:127-1605(-)
MAAPADTKDVLKLPSYAATPKGPPPLSEVIERLGFGWAQLRCAIIGGAVFLADGAELLLIGTVTRAVSSEWGMPAWQRGLVVSVVFVGILLGNAMSGPMGDNFGRRMPIIASYAGIAVFSVLSAMTNSFYQLASARLLVGIAFGFGQPAAIAQCVEVTPVYWRTLVQAVVQGSFIIGELYSALLVWYDDPEMKNLDWRWLLMMGAIPSAVYFFLAIFFLPQSPNYLACHGEDEAATKVLEGMRHDNGLPDDVSVEFRAIPPRAASTPLQRAMEPMAIVFSLPMLYTTCVSIYSCFVLNVVFYGCLYAFPQVVADVDMGSSPAVALIIGALWEIPGSLLSVICALFMSVRPVTIASLSLMFVSMLSFTLGAEAHVLNSEKDTTVWHAMMLHGGYMGIKAFTYVAFVAIYTFAAEIYPTRARTTGSAASVAGGRVGGMIAPLLFEELADRTGGFSAFFYTMMGFIALNLMLILPVTTKAADDDDHESQPVVLMH